MIIHLLAIVTRKDDSKFTAWLPILEKPASQHILRMVSQSFAVKYSLVVHVSYGKVETLAIFSVDDFDGQVLRRARIRQATHRFGIEQAKGRYFHINNRVSSQNAYHTGEK